MNSPGLYRKSPPPMPASTSLDGLEIGVPPPNYSLNCLDKPLPGIPDRTSSLYSTENSSLDSYTEKLTGQDDFLLSARKRAQSETNGNSSRFYRRRNVAHRNSFTRSSDRHSLNFKAFLTEEQYGVGMHLAKANHYFREKKWDMFPELGPQSAMSDTSPAVRSSQKSLTRPRIPKVLSKQQLLKPVTSHIRTGVDHVKPVASHIQHTLVHKTSKLRLRKKSSLTSNSATTRSRGTSASSSNDSDATLIGVVDSSDVKGSKATVRQRMREMSPWSRSESKEESISLWKSTSTTVLNIVSQAETKFTKSNLARSYSQSLKKQPSESSSSTVESLRMTEKPMLSIQTQFQASVVSLPGCAKAIRQKSNFVLVAYDGAKQKLASVQAARRRADLKRHIRVIGPMDKYPDGSVNQWV